MSEFSIAGPSAVATASINPLSEALESGLADMQVELPQAMREQLVRYVELLHKWNKAYNLTAVRDPMEMVSRHLLDSLSLREHLRGEQILDVGSGGGLPGLPLAITEPNRRFTLLDSNGKKTRFLQQVALELSLKNVTVEQSRAEAYTPAADFDCVTARAVAEPDVIFKMACPYVVQGGRMLIMAGPNQAWPKPAPTLIDSQEWRFGRQPLNAPQATAERAVCIAERIN